MQVNEPIWMMLLRVMPKWVENDCYFSLWQDLGPG